MNCDPTCAPRLRGTTVWPPTFRRSVPRVHFRTLCQARHARARIHAHTQMHTQTYTHMRPVGPSRGPVGAQSGPVEAQSGPVGAQSGPSRAQSGPSRAQSGPSRVQSGPVGAQSGSSRAQSGPSRAQSGSSRGPVGPSRANGDPTGHDWAVVTDAHLWETGHCRRVTLPPPLDDLVFFFTEARAEDFVGGMATTTPPHKAQPRSLEPKGHEPLGKALASEITRYQEI